MSCLCSFLRLGVQAESTQPLVERHSGVASTYDGPQSQAASIVVRRPRNGLRLMAELRASDGTMVAVSDAQIADSQRRLATDGGLVCEFTSAATLAGLVALGERESLSGQTAVLVVTGGRVD